MSAGKRKRDWTGKDWELYRTRMGRQYAREFMKELSLTGQQMWRLSEDIFHKRDLDVFLTKTVRGWTMGTRAEMIETAPFGTFYGFSSAGRDGFGIQVELAKQSLGRTIHEYLLRINS